MTFALQVDRINEDAAILAMADDTVSSRLAVKIELQDGTQHRAVVDSAPITIGGHDYEPVPFAEFSDLSSAQGRAADVLTVALDSGAFMQATGESADDVLDTLARLARLPLRDRFVQVSRIVLDVNTAEPIGLFPEFVGFVDQGRLAGEDAPAFELRVAGFLAYARERATRYLRHDDHLARHPGDNFLRHMSDTVNRGRAIAWNSNEGGSRPIVPSISLFNR